MVNNYQLKFSLSSFNYYCYFFFFYLWKSANTKRLSYRIRVKYTMVGWKKEDTFYNLLLLFLVQEYSIYLLHKIDNYENDKWLHSKKSKFPVCFVKKLLFLLIWFFDHLYRWTTNDNLVWTSFSEFNYLNKNLMNYIYIIPTYYIVYIYNLRKYSNFINVWNKIVLADFWYYDNNNFNIANVIHIVLNDWIKPYWMSNYNIIY